MNERFYAILFFVSKKSLRLLSRQILRWRLPELFLERAQERGVGIEACHHGDFLQRVLVFSVFAVQQAFGFHQAEVVDVVVERLVFLLVDVVAQILPVGA